MNYMIKSNVNEMNDNIFNNFYFKLENMNNNKINKKDKKYVKMIRKKV